MLCVAKKKLAMFCYVFKYLQFIYCVNGIIARKCKQYKKCELKIPVSIIFKIQVDELCLREQCKFDCKEESMLLALAIFEKMLLYSPHFQGTFKTNIFFYFSWNVSQWQWRQKSNNILLYHCFLTFSCFREPSCTQVLFIYLFIIFLRWTIRSGLSSFLWPFKIFFHNFSNDINIAIILLDGATWSWLFKFLLSSCR